MFLELTSLLVILKGEGVLLVQVILRVKLFFELLEKRPFFGFWN